MWKSLKGWPVLLALLVAVGVLAVALHYLAYGNRVTRANCKRVHKGMTMEEVRAILGKPWDNSLLDPEGPGEKVAIPLHVHVAQNLWLEATFYWLLTSTPMVMPCLCS
jgi:hypothetical protein